MRADEYSRMAQQEESHWWYRSLRDRVAQEIRVLQKSSSFNLLLDAGCGTGGMLQRLSSEFPNLKLQGMDPHPNAISFTQSKNNISVFSGNVNQIPLLDQTLDAVVCLDVICHQAVEEDLAFHEIHRVLRKKGVLMINLPAFEALRGEHDIVVEIARRYQKKDVERLARQHGFECHKLIYWNGLLFPLFWIWRKWSSLFPSPTQPRSDLERGSALFHLMMGAILKSENLILDGKSMPWGTSIFAVLQKQ